MLNGFEIITGCSILINGLNEANYNKYCNFIQEFIEHEIELDLGFLVMVDKEQP